MYSVEKCASVGFRKSKITQLENNYKELLQCYGVTISHNYDFEHNMEIILIKSPFVALVHDLYDYITSSKVSELLVFILDQYKSIPLPPNINIINRIRSLDECENRFETVLEYLKREKIEDVIIEFQNICIDNPDYDSFIVKSPYSYFNNSISTYIQTGVKDMLFELLGGDIDERCDIKKNN